MAIISLHTSLFLLIVIANFGCLSHFVLASDESVSGTERQALEIIIGGGGGAPAPENVDCPPPPPEPICPPPPPPPPPPSPPPPKPSPSPPPPSPPPPKRSPPPPSPPPPKRSPPPPSPPPPKRSPPPPPPSPPPPKRSPPPPSPFPNERIERAYRTIQEFRNIFKKNPEYDPKGITKTWNNNDVCNYKGFACEKRPDIGKLAVAAVDFNGFALGGGKVDISKFLGQMVDLAIFHANSNNFTGFTPKDLSPNVIKYFYEFDLSNNKYSGEFPSSVLKATNLTFLDIRFNQYYGSVLGEVFTLDLDVLFVNNNRFTGYLPDNLGSTPALYLTFANNEFTGPIPSSIGKCKNLREVLFLNNHFSGCLPYEVGFLGNLTVFDVGTNDLHGPIPHSFSCLKKLEILNLAYNEFYGPVPEMLCDLPKVENLTLSHNYFTQVGPKCMNLIHRKRLNVKMNCILGLPNQRSPEECIKFFAMHKTCPNEKSLTYIPCKTKSGYVDSVDKTQDTMAPAPSPRIYDALKPHKLRL